MRAHTCCRISSLLSSCISARSSLILTLIALLGGVIIDRFSYEAVFFLTAGMQSVATLIYALLLGVVFPERRAPGAAAATAAEDTQPDGGPESMPESDSRAPRSSGGVSLNKPLLGDGEV